ncbi:MAG: UDP-N-acetylmuramoyl-L-alanyl-D-glutamate--2,6-diaminopimelate ligase [bacterium]
MPKRLDELIQGLRINKIIGDDKINISGVSYHSQKIKPNFLFVAIDGSKTSGKEFIAEAISNGAVAVATSEPPLTQNPMATIIQVENPKVFLAELANRFYDFPSQKVELIGITGTNGKTTTAYLVKSILDNAGKTAGLLGTIRHFDGENWLKAENTTPESLDIIRILSGLWQKKIKYCVLEVSSHGLELNRVYGLRFQIGVFTNLSQDHLDFHKTIEAYKAAKLKLFSGLEQNAIAIINQEDELSAEIVKITKARTISYSMKNQADITAKILNLSAGGTRLRLNVTGKEMVINFHLIGSHNVYNLLAAASVGLAYNMPMSEIKAGIEKVKVIPGRMESLDNDKGVAVFVDYAHTPAALRELITTAREFTKKRVLLMFGCGGNRDQLKRPLMGKIATELADYVILTSDNPRDEDSSKIIQDIKAGISKNNFEVIPDRFAAIRRILFLAKIGDTVLIAGKGHEDYQIIGQEKRRFDDRLMAKRILEG